jgi:hypothetical protein
MEKQNGKTERDSMTEQQTGRVIREEVVHTPEDTDAMRVEHQEKVIPSYEERKQQRIQRINRVLYFVVHVITIFLAIRFFLLLLGVNPENTFAIFIYGLTAPFAAPFTGLFGDTPDPTYGRAIFEAADLVAIAMYYLFAWIISKLVIIFVSRTYSEHEHSEQKQTAS